MSLHYLHYQNTKLAYSKTGTGNRTLILFHGFGQNHFIFNTLTSSLSDYTFYSIDLFFHGESEWPHHEQPLEKEFWKQLFTQLLAENNIDTFSVLGFSMGAKFALGTLESFPDRVKEIFLLAPDGIKTSMWYSLATYPIALRNLFKSMIQKPERFQAIANFAFRVKLIDKGILRFVESQMNTEEKRKRVYNSWVVFRHLNFSMKAIGDTINRYGITLVIVVGKYDKIITAKNMTNLTRHVHQYQVEVIETGHNNIIDASSKILGQLK